MKHFSTFFAAMLAMAAASGAVAQNAPDIAQGYPQVKATTDASATVVTRWSAEGNLYSMVKPAGDEAPDAEELKSGRPAEFQADTEVTTEFNLLDQLTDYKAYFLAVSASGAESGIIVSPQFTTLETIEPLTVGTDYAGGAFNEGESLTVEATATGGKMPYTFEWTDQTGKVIGSDATLTCTVSVNGTYRVCATSADGQKAHAKILVDVLNANLAIADFEDLALEPESNWMFDTTLPSDVTSDIFYSGSFRFPNYPWFEYAAWSGFGYANETSTAFNDYHDQFRNIVGAGAAGTKSYGVAYMIEGKDMSVNINTASDEGAEIPGIYVTNTAYAVNSILNGDGWCEKFTAEKGDYFTIFIEGLNAAGLITSTIEIPLADFRTSAASPVLSEWKWFDLSSLGKVKKLRFSFDSSQKDRVPAYVCIDRIGAPDPASGALDNVSADTPGITIPADGLLSVTGIEDDYTLSIYSPDGIVRARHTLTGTATVSTADLASGAYIADIVDHAGNHSAIRFIKR